MVDTIILQIPISYSAIINPDRFKPNAKLLNGGHRILKYVNNQTGEERKAGIYRPKLTLLHRERIYLKIEFSAPKLIFGNNLDELAEENFNEIIDKLRMAVQEMGVRLWTHEIENAEAIGFHPSKNIPLTAGYTACFAINECAKINLTEKMDIERVCFRNGGEALQLYSNRHSFVLYDKINDLNKPPKRAIDKNQTIRQMELFDYIKKEKADLEILRLEVRLSHAKKMREVLAKVGFQDAPLFKNVFKKDLCQKIVKLYWEEFFGKDLFLFNVNNNPQNILQMILMKYPKTNIRAGVLLTGLNLLCKDEGGIRTFRNIARNYRPKSSWARISAYLRKFEANVFSQPAHGFIKDIEENLDKFEAFRLNKLSG